ncbi:hypothetical protein C0995_011593 [Termitomyces sp. Mi166|nr:hypothetical protein C0995_011593 [Termitomyces sp. Mi166\
MGWKTPVGTLPWSPEVSIKAMDASGIDMAILSLPALSTGSICEENRNQARQRNTMMSSIVCAHSTRFAFFACIPFLDDVEGVLKEISYALDVLHAVGISMSSSYGVDSNAKYIGDDQYEPVWAELNRRKTVVFLHGAQVRFFIPQFKYTVDTDGHKVPHETFKAAAHLVVSGRKRKYSDVKIILAHLGGTTPMLASRVAVLSNHMGCSLSPEEILEDFRTYYYETALSSYGPTLACLNAFVPPDRLLFGTDFPAVGIDMAEWYTANLKEHYGEDNDRLETVLGGNALTLFPKLRYSHLH